MLTPLWIDSGVVLALHDTQLREHGGLSGLRDTGLLQSALSRPRNLFAYGEPDLPALAAAYGFGLARNHPFFDGNKRTAWVVTRTFLLLNDMDLVASHSAKLEAMLALASGDLSEDDFATWIRDRTRPVA